MKQIELLNFSKKTAFGGSLLNGNNPNGPRPISSKHAMHVVLRSELARGKWSMRRREHGIDRLVRSQAKRWGIRIYRFANVGNHLHILARTGSRRRFQGFIRSITGLIARKILNAERGQAAKNRFWQARPFSRVVKWGNDYLRAKEYVELNASEALGFLSPRMIKKMLNETGKISTA